MQIRFICLNSDPDLIFAVLCEIYIVFVFSVVDGRERCHPSHTQTVKNALFRTLGRPLTNWCKKKKKDSSSITPGLSNLALIMKREQAQHAARMNHLRDEGFSC